MHALIVGATGATGSDLLALLLGDPTFQRVDIFVRRPVDLHHEKLHIHVINFDQVAEWQHLVQGDVLYSCLGTTLKDAGTKETQWKIDYSYQYAFAKAARDNGVMKMVLVSASMASPDSKFFYSKMKGQLEVAVKALDFPYLHIFKPPMLLREGSDRKGELFASKIIKLFNKIGVFKSQTPLPTEILAQALIAASKQQDKALKYYEGSAIWDCARK